MNCLDITIIFDPKKQHFINLLMKRYVFPLQTSLLFLLFIQSLIVMQSNIKQYFWGAIVFISIISYIYQGARPYSPLFFFIAIADYFQFDTAQISILVVIALLMVFLEFYHIQIVGKGPYNAGYKYIKTDNYEISVFYPSMNDGEHAKWIPSQTYSSALYDITYVNPVETRMPFRIFNFILSYLFKLKMPVLGDATLYTNDSIKQQKWSIIIFSHGLGSNLNNYSALCGWWASHGYIVVSIQHNHDLIRIQFPSDLVKQPDILEKIFYKSRNNDLRTRSREMETILDEILEKDMLAGVFKEKRIIIDRVFLAGHSYGGATALETMANLIKKQKDHSKISGLICLDSWFFPLSQSTYQNLKNQNILLIHSQTFFSVVPYFYYMQQKLKRLKSVNQQTMKPFVVTNTDHLSISDFVFTFGRLFQLMKTVRMQPYAKPILQIHQIMIALFMSGKSKEEILKISNHYSEKYDIAKKGVKVLEQWRYSKAQKQ